MSETTHLPPVKLPLVYHAFATFCFALALAGAISFAQDLTGFYYHPRILALTHLITLGWISGNILGTMYMVAPIALHTHLPAKRFDWFVFSLYSIGVSGMVAHFWRDRPVGMAWSAGCVYLAFLLIGPKFISSLLKSRTPGFVKLHVLLAFGNLLIGGAWGFLLSIHKVHGFLPTSSSPNVIAHAHLAAIGWATMMVFGIAYRLLPMFIPGKPASGYLPWISAISLEIGAVGFFLTTLLEIEVRPLFAILIGIGILLFLYSAIRTLSMRKPAPPPEPPRPDFSLLHAPFSFLCLVICFILGILLLRAPSNERTLQIALGYAALGLVGFLSQIVTGLKPKILSIFTWYHAFSRNPSGTLPRPVDMPVRIFQIMTFALWIAGVPAIFRGIVSGAAFLIRAGAIFLFAAVIISTMHEIAILKLIWRDKRKG